MRLKNSDTTFRAGFTLIEVLMVVVIIAVAATIVVPQMLSAGTLGIQAAARLIISDILYAQNDAIAQQGTRRVVFDVGANNYRLADQTGNTLSVNWLGPDGGDGNYIVDFSSDRRFQGVTLRAVDFGGSQELLFDALGSPLSGGSVEIEFQNTRYRVSVASFTGRVTVQQITGG